MCVCVCIYIYIHTVLCVYIHTVYLSPVSSYFGWVMSAAAPFPFVGSLHFIIEVVRSLWAICSQCLESISVYS